MKHILKMAMSLSLAVGITATCVAAAPISEATPAKAAAKNNFHRPHRHKIHRNVYTVYGGRNRVIRVRRLSRPQVREFYRRMLDIYTN